MPQPDGRPTKREALDEFWEKIAIIDSIPLPRDKPDGDAQGDSEADQSPS